MLERLNNDIEAQLRMVRAFMLRIQDWEESTPLLVTTQLEDIEDKLLELKVRTNMIALAL
jgi:hypothetical protein